MIPAASYVFSPPAGLMTASCGVCDVKVLGSAEVFELQAMVAHAIAHLTAASAASAATGAGHNATRGLDLRAPGGLDSLGAGDCPLGPALVPAVGRWAAVTDPLRGGRGFAVVRGLPVGSW